MIWESSEKKRDAYELMLAQQKGLLEAEKHWLASLANSSALLEQTLPATVFAGYYLLEDGELILGPFQGHVSCTRIAMGKGVCGEAADKQKTLIVADVRQHKNYIACDSTARSEIVVPLLQDGRLLGVLDIDSSQTSAYDDIDREYLEKYAALLMAKLTLP